jgi:hypothetical protein
MFAPGGTPIAGHQIVRRIAFVRTLRVFESRIAIAIRNGSEAATADQINTSVSVPTPNEVSKRHHRILQIAANPPLYF